MSKPLPKELSPVAEVSVDLEINEEVKAIADGNQQGNRKESRNNPEADSSSNNGEKEEKPENPQMYDRWQPEEIDKPANRSQVQKLMSSLLDRFSHRTRKPKEAPQPETKLEQLNNWLVTDDLYDEAIKAAKAGGYQIKYDSTGVAIYISEPEF